MLYHEVPLEAESTIPMLEPMAGTGHQEGVSFLLFLKGGQERTVAPTGVLAVHSERRGVVGVDGVRYGETGAGPVHRPPRTLPGGCAPGAPRSVFRRDAAGPGLSGGRRERVRAGGGPPRRAGRGVGPWRGDQRRD